MEQNKNQNKNVINEATLTQPNVIPTTTTETVVPTTTTETVVPTTKFEKSKEPEHEAYGIYNEKGHLIKIFRKGPHGDNFADLAVKFAERKGENFIAKPYLDPVDIKDVDVDTVHILTTNDQPVRTFSLKVHGKEYKKLAEQFIAKYGNKKGYKIKK